MIIGTLGNTEFPSTCSYVAVVGQFPGSAINLYSTFEEAVHCLKRHEVDKVVIPAAYPKINPIIMDEDLEAVNSFIFKIPALVLAAKNVSDSEFECLYFHEATLSLLNRIEDKFCFKSKQTANSNTEAALQAALSDKNACITNFVCVGKFGLNILQTVKSGFKMPFIEFKDRG
ncbi:hypothetical protein [Neisseria yangbaofengii]|uniref:hypothetical protein n=1 Tax=Neisseria yangbaofengii TaxID=2709396 RepID=UPI0013EA1ED5|nr:hypothetical protein [Neisseria yangbaofengii]